MMTLYILFPLLKEERYMRENNGRPSQKYKDLLQSIENLIPGSLEAYNKHHFR